MPRRFSFLAAFAALVAPPAVGAPSSPASPQVAPDIVVKATTPHTMDTYVRQVIAPGDRGQLARWNKPICMRIINLGSPNSDIIESRITAIGHGSGVQFAPRPCKANVLIIATTDPDGAVTQIRDGYPQLFRFRDNGDRPCADYKDLLKPLPVRWINADETVSADGVDLSTGSLADNSLAGSGLPINNVISPGSIDTSTREDTAFSIVVIDANKVGGVTTSHLADYLTMVVLGHPRFGAPFKGNTIMTLFARSVPDAEAPDALTPMDLSLLKNLYSTANLRTADQQRASIEYRMRHPQQYSKKRGESEDQSAGNSPAGQ